MCGTQSRYLSDAFLLLFHSIQMDDTVFIFGWTSSVQQQNQVEPCFVFYFILFFVGGYINSSALFRVHNVNTIYQ